jgi:hypothetical protein
VACGQAGEAVSIASRLDVLPPDGPADLALVDVAVYAERFVASRAMWDAAKIREVVLTRALPGAIGLSAIGAHLPDANHAPGCGLYLRMGPGGRVVLAPIAPGLVQPVDLVESRRLGPGDEVVIRHTEPGVLALDGERELELPPGATVRVRLQPDGPRVVDVRRAIEVAARAGVFVGGPAGPRRPERP